MRLSVDTNVLVYMLDGRDPVRQRASVSIVAALGGCDAVLTLQALVEFFFVVVRKRMAPAAVASAHLADLRTVFGDPVPTSAASFERAQQAWVAGRFGYWDAMLMAAAGSGGCQAVISEDMHHGSELDGVRVIGAFDALGEVSASARAALGLA